MRLDYVDVVDAVSLKRVSRLRGKVLVPLAAYLGKTRLIDNVELTMEGGDS